MISKLDTVTKNPPKGEGKADAAFQSGMEKLIKERKKAKAGPQLQMAPKGYQRSGGTGFLVAHYASDVVYETLEWVDKNADKLTLDIYKCFEGSKDDQVVAPIYTKLAMAAGSGKSASVASSFKRQLVRLSETLTRCETNFVRCIKTNKQKAAAALLPAALLCTD